MENKFFCAFDDIVAPQLKILGIQSQTFYATVFHKDYEHVLANRAESDVDNLFATGAEISQWRSNERPLPERIYRLVLSNPLETMNRYEEDLSKLFKEKNLTDDDLEGLSHTLLQFSKDNEKYSVCKPLSEKADHLCACALENAIFCDGAKAYPYTVLSNDIGRDIKKAQFECRKENVAFTNARILKILLNKQSSLLLDVLNQFRLGDLWKNDIDSYISQSKHREYHLTPEYNEWLLMSVITAARNNRIRANEIDILSAMIDISGSSTIDQLKADLKKQGADLKEWVKFIQETDIKRSRSSFKRKNLL